MSLDSAADEYFVTALQIFDYCGADNTTTLRVDALMDKFAPFVKTNKAEYSYLRSLLDPEQSNPEITVTKLATALNKYSESQKVKVDLDESFNLRSGTAPHDSDSGISTDGFQLLEELQCELKEKSHQAQQLRSQLEFCDRQHEEALAALTAERNSLRAHLNMLREENLSLIDVRRDYEDVCERLASTERALDEASRDRDCTQRRAKVLHEQVALLENEKLTLQELLTKSKAECHRINEMYASRQSVLLEKNETLRAEHADLSARLHDQERFMQQMIKEKVLLEMELKDLVNKSNQTQLRMERSIDVSYTDDQMLTALDSLNSDSRFAQENQILDEESFANALREDQGRATNMSLFDEIRLSFCNMSRHNITELDTTRPKHDPDMTLITVSTQTDEHKTKELKITPCITIECAQCTENQRKCFIETCTQTDIVKKKSAPKASSTQTSKIPYRIKVIKTTQPPKLVRKTNTDTQTICYVTNNGTQTDIIEECTNNNTIENCIDCTKCSQCEKMKKYTDKLKSHVKRSDRTVASMQVEITRYEANLDMLTNLVTEGDERNNYLREVVNGLKEKLEAFEIACTDQEEKIDRLACETCNAEIQTESEQSCVATQAEIPCGECVKRNSVPHRRLKKYLWDPLKCLFQVFAVICFISALWVLYGIARSPQRCRDSLPWRWFHAQDLMDLFLRIEYVSEVPM